MAARSDLYEKAHDNIPFLLTQTLKYHASSSQPSRLNALPHDTNNVQLNVVVVVVVVCLVLDAMAHVFALDSFARARFSHHAIPAMANTAPKLAIHGGPVYYRQHEVIQLVEVPAPPRQQQHPSTISSSSLASSAYSESCESEADSQDSESIVSSYCSSDEEASEDGSHACYDDTYGTRLSRVLAWREAFAKAMGVALTSDSMSPPQSSLLKRRMDQDNDDAMSHSSKRSRSEHHASTTLVDSHVKPFARRPLSSHSCSACDSDFATPQSLQEHAQRSNLGEACRAAVQYGLEP